MKAMTSGKSNLKGIVPVMLCLIGWAAPVTQVWSQNAPLINARFVDPQFDSKNMLYTLDVELKSANTREFLFGMNVRFFYDASKLEFQQIDDIMPGYGIRGETPKAFIGNESSGQSLFALSGPTGYINTAVQLLNDLSPLEINPQTWVKVFRVSFKVPFLFPDEIQFCPSVIWDLKSGNRAGSFLNGGAGLVLTVTENNRTTRLETAPAVVAGEPFNWQYNKQGDMPYGQIVQADCITVGSTVATEDLNPDGYGLFQNKPNPFVEKTVIEFILPNDQEATLKVFDMQGKPLQVYEGYYHTGRNVIELEYKPWMTASNQLLYRLETDDYISGFRSMTLVRK